MNTPSQMYRSSRPSVLKICNKFTEEHPCQSAFSTLIKSVLKMAYQKVGPGTRDVYRLDPGTQNPKMSRWDTGPQKWDLWPGLPIFYSFNRLLYTYYFTLYLLQNFALISLLTYFMAHIQKQPLRCVINFKKLWAVT